MFDSEKLHGYEIYSLLQDTIYDTRLNRNEIVRGEDVFQDCAELKALPFATPDRTWI